MRKIFEPQYSLDIFRIEDTKVNLKSRDAFPKLILALLEIYKKPAYNSKIFSILEAKIITKNNHTGRKGLNLWQIFVLAQVRLALNISYDRLHDLVNNHQSLRQLLGIERTWNSEKIVIEYQNIVDNVKLLDDETLKQINIIIVQIGHDVFKKKEAEELQLKTDSFVVLSNVHFPTDYNLLWDSIRKTLDTINKIIKKYNIKGWRKIGNWKRELKNLTRNVGQSTRKKPENKKSIVEEYLKKAKLLLKKVQESHKNLPLRDLKDLTLHSYLEYYIEMMEKHIDLLERRVIKGETIPHKEKLFSIFETYTEWKTKGKRNPDVELGKNLQVTTDQYHLIIDFEIMEEMTDNNAVISIGDRVLEQYKTKSWSFDKGYFSKENKELLGLFVDDLVMPKKGKLNKKEYEEEHKKEFKVLRHKHSAIESNINELGHRGLDKCPDRGYQHYKNYIALGVCAYNLHRIGAELMRQAKAKQKLQ